MNLNEVSPPGWGHTKAEKEKTKPNKPKSKIGGSAAAFKRALDDGRFKGLPGSKTKKEKTADMFKLMWSMKKKGDKPHYKPGTDKKYKKYQEEETSMQDNNLFGNAYAYDKLKKKVGSKKKHNKPAVEEGVLSTIGRPKKKVEKKPEKAMDAGARARRKVARRVHAKYVSGSENLVPDDIREEPSMPNVSSNDKKAIKDRAKNLFKKDLKGTHDGVNEAAGGGVPITPQELQIQKKMSMLNVRLARKRSQALASAKVKDTESAPEQVKEGSLRKWFKGSKSKDGKGGWVNVVTGGTCASDEPGEGTPKCVSSSKRASMTKAERLSASRRKKAADPGQQSKSGAAKPTYVRTDAKKKMNEDKVLKTVAKELDGASKMHKGQANKIKKHLKDMRTEAKKTKNCGCGQDPCITYGKKEKVDEACWKGYKAYGMKKKGGKMVPNCKPVGSVKKEGYQRNPEADPRSARQKRMDDPKKGINSPAFRAFMAAQQQSSKPKKKVDEDYYAGTGEKVAARTKKYMDKKGMKGAPGLDAMKARTAEHKAKRGVSEAKVDQGRSDYGKASIRNYRRSGPGHGEPAMFDPENKRGKLIDKRREEHKARRGVKGAKVPAYKTEEVVNEEDKKGKGSKEEFEGWANNTILEKTAAWTRKEGKNKEGGLNEKGRKSYEKANPGSDLKAPQPEGGSRKKSFCARMGGMKKKLTSSKTANDPDSRINKALRKWKC
jgi:hypothetical protein